eukprot:6193475-Pleurochrysis_carterae.AAC.1
MHILVGDNPCITLHLGARLAVFRRSCEKCMISKSTRSWLSSSIRQRVPSRPRGTKRSPEGADFVRCRLLSACSCVATLLRMHACT